MKVLRVVDWDKHFENNRTRELVQMRWVPFRNSFDSDGFVELMEEDNGLQWFACWVLIVEVASTCTPRGILIRGNGTAHDSKTIARKTRGGSPDIFLDAIAKLQEIGWLEEIELEDIPQEPATPPQPTAHRRKEENRTEGNGKSQRKRFTPPSVEEVRAYCIERKNGIDPSIFFDFYEANGWVQGKGKPVRDWKACVRTWERNTNSIGFQNQRQNQSRPPLDDLT